MPETDLEYHERRITDEQMLSVTASSPEAASAHRALAVIYADEVRRMRDAATPLQLVASERSRN